RRKKANFLSSGDQDGFRPTPSFRRVLGSPLAATTHTCPLPGARNSSDPQNATYFPSWDSSGLPWTAKSGNLASSLALEPSASIAKAAIDPGCCSCPWASTDGLASNRVVTTSDARTGRLTWSACGRRVTTPGVV